MQPCQLDGKKNNECMNGRVLPEAKESPFFHIHTLLSLPGWDCDLLFWRKLFLHTNWALEFRVILLNL